MMLMRHKWHKDSDNYEHQHGLPEPVLELLEPIYKDLCDPNLLEKCLHGTTKSQ